MPPPLSYAVFDVRMPPEDTGPGAYESRVQLSEEHEGKPVVRWFLSYAHEDESLKAELLKELEPYLAVSEKYHFELWDDRQILVGDDWDAQIKRGLTEAHVGVLLLSPAFLNSHYISATELPAFVAGTGGAVPGKRAVPVLLKPLPEGTPLKGLELRQIFRGGQPNKAESFAHVKEREQSVWVHALHAQLEELLDRYADRRSTPEPPAPQQEPSETRIVPVSGDRTPAHQSPALQGAAAGTLKPEAPESSQEPSERGAAPVVGDRAPAQQPPTLEAAGAYSLVGGWRNGLLIAGLSLVMCTVHACGPLDLAFGLDTRLRAVLGELHRMQAPAVAEQALAVVIDAQTEAALAASVAEDDKPLGPFGARWRGSTAQVISRLAGAGASVVALDMTFARPAASADEVVLRGTAALAQAIRDARAAGTAVVFLGDRTDHGMETAPELLTQQASSSASPIAPVSLSHECHGIRERGGLAELPMLLVDKQALPWPGIPALSVAAVAAHWGLAVGDVRGAQLVLEGDPAPSRALRLAAYKSGHDVQRSECAAMRPNDRAAVALLQVDPDPVRRGHALSLAYESVLRGEPLQVAKRLVLVGAQLPRLRDKHRVFACDTAPLDCGTRLRSGLSLHLDATNSLLAGRTFHAPGFFSQYALMVTCCLVAFLVGRCLGGRSWRRWALLGWMVAQLLLAGLAAVYLGCLMDVLYSIVASVLAYWLARRGGRRVAA